MQFVVPPDHPALPGHFPGRPIVPGVVVLDRVLDAIERDHGALGALRLPQVKFVQTLLPGEVADLTVESIDTLPGEGGRWRFRVSRAGAPIASGEVVAA
jgi:3-hydroxyacyl-[acyl-carrier-protein] dehydratase